MAFATSFVNRSWICSRRLNISAIRGSLEMPITALAGMYPMCIWSSRVSIPCYNVLGFPGVKIPYLSCEWNHVVLAQAENFNVFYNDHLVVSLVEDGVVYDVAHVLLVALGEEEHCLCISCRRVQQALTVRILPNAFQDCPDGALQFVDSLLGLLGAFFESFSSAAA
jgi:hypothetical protein